MPTPPIKVAIAQIGSHVANVDANWDRAAQVIGEAAAGGARLVVFPECFLQGYGADEKFAATAVELSGEFGQVATDLAHQYGVWIIMGLARTDHSHPHLVYNSAAVIGPKSELTAYDKVHLGTYQAYREGVYFARGRDLPVFDLPFARVGVQICYDMSFPEVSRVLALQGAEINVVLSAGPDEFRSSWGPLLQVRSSENVWWTIYANTVGHQGSTHFFGESRIVGPDGTVRVQGPYDTEACIFGEINLTESRLRRRSTLRFRDRVPSLYRAIGEGNGR